MTEILIENEQTAIEITPGHNALIKRAIEEALSYEDCDFDSEVSVTITDDIRIHEINLETRGIDKPTDVLSFPMLEFDENGDIINSDFDMDEDLLMLGDIVISAERAKAQAEEYGHSFERELAFLTVHSMLHLLGYDHLTSEEDERIMFGKQEEILINIGLRK